MKYILLISLFLIGCVSEIKPLDAQVVKDVEDLKIVVNILQSRIDGLSYKYGTPVTDDARCIRFKEELDTHAGASYTIPVVGKYKYRTWDDIQEVWHEKYLQPGMVLHKAIEVIKDTCPKYDTIDKKGL